MKKSFKNDHKEIITIIPSDINNNLYYLIGVTFIILNFIRHKIQGYKTPRSFPVCDIDSVITYDFQVIDKWLKALKDYSNDSFSIKDKVILELGPGSDLGVGLILLAMGAKKYIALDVNNLAFFAPKELYKLLFNRLGDRFPGLDQQHLQLQLEKCLEGNPDRLRYIVDKNFDIKQIKDPIDIVFSQAAFEHFPNVDKVIKQLSDVVKNSGYFVAEIDLKTHTRWIRDKDPLNIYRYNENFWNIFKFNGSPNRVRSDEYTRLFTEYGWTDINVTPIAILDEKYTDKVKPTLNKSYRYAKTAEMQMLSILISALKR